MWLSIISFWWGWKLDKSSANDINKSLLLFDTKGIRINSMWPCDNIICQRSWSPLAWEVMTCCLFSSKPLPEPMFIYHQRWSVASTWEHFYKKSSWTYYSICSEITCSKLLHLLGANELKTHIYSAIIDVCTSLCMPTVNWHRVIISYWCRQNLEAITN